MTRRLYLYTRWLLARPLLAFDAHVCAWANPDHHPAVLHRLRYGLPRLPGDPFK